MTDLVTFLDNNGKSAAYIGGNIHVLYYYLEIIGAPKHLSLQVSDLIILFFRPPSTMIQKLSSKLLQISS